MAKEVKVQLPQREKRRILVDLPTDQIKMLDDCSNALALSRSAFLTIFFDAFSEHVISFAEGFLRGYYYEKEQQEKKLLEAKEVAEKLTGGKMSVAKQRGKKDECSEAKRDNR